MSRIPSHVVETRSLDAVKSLIDSFSQNGDYLVRSLSERDYGIDYLLEVFDNSVPSGNIAFLQVKGTTTTIQRLAKSDEISCPNISVSNLMYAKQRIIPVILIYISLADTSFFYFSHLNLHADYYLSRIKEKQKTISIRIPFENNSKKIAIFSSTLLINTIQQVANNSALFTEGTCFSKS